MKPEAGKIYLIPTPIGDVPVYDAVPEANGAVIRSLDYFIVENLRSARRFLVRAGIGKPIDSLMFAELNEHSTPEDVQAALKPVLEGRNAGVISEAGVPAVADPGSDLVALAHSNGVEVVPLVGPSSIILALMASGMNGQSFAFNGYLPVKQPERSKAIRFFEARALKEGQSQIFIEAPYRNDGLLRDILASCSAQTRLTLAVNILQPGQFIKTRTISQWKAGVPSINKLPAIFIIG